MNKSKWVSGILLGFLIAMSTFSALGSDVEISGSAKFKKQVSQALLLLEKNAPEAYAIVTQYVGRIEQGGKSGMWASKAPPTYELADGTTFYSVTWCASTIAHDSFHSKLYHEYKSKHRGPVPDHVWTGVEAEKQCLKHQMEVLKEIKAPKHEISYFSKLHGDHHDTNSDGKYDWEDYKKTGLVNPHHVSSAEMGTIAGSSRTSDHEEAEHDALEMNKLLTATITLLALVGSAVAGHPIILNEVEACSGAELVVVATLAAAEDVPADDPFEFPEWTDLGFTKFSKAKVQQVLLGTPPKDLRVYGGKLGAGTDYRLETGSFLMLLTKVKDDAYRAVDWHYSFAPIKDGKVGWLVDRFREKREWISPDEALRRIQANQTKNKQRVGSPTSSRGPLPHAQ